MRYSPSSAGEKLEKKKFFTRVVFDLLFWSLASRSTDELAGHLLSISSFCEPLLCNPRYFLLLAWREKSQTQVAAYSIDTTTSEVAAIASSIRTKMQNGEIITMKENVLATDTPRSAPEKRARAISDARQHEQKRRKIDHNETSSPRVMLASLPNEIILNIMSFLLRSDNFRFTLAFPRIIPFCRDLYKRLDVRGQQYNGRFGTLQLLLERISQTPEIAWMIEGIYASLDQYPGEDPLLHRNTPELLALESSESCEPWRGSVLDSEARVSKFFELIQCGFPEKNDLLQRLVGGGDTAGLGLLALAPNVKSISISPPDTTDDVLDLCGQILLARSITVPPKFQNLASFSVHAWGHDHYSLPISLSRVLQLPSLREMSLADCEESWDLEHWHCPEGSSPVTELTLMDCRFTDKALVKLLHSVKGLRAFHCSATDHDVDRLMPRGPDPGFALYNIALTPHKDTLEDLMITLDKWEYSWAWSYRGIGSLKHFSKLKRIEAAGIIFLGAEYPEIEESISDEESEEGSDGSEESEGGESEGNEDEHGSETTSTEDGSSDPEDLRELYQILPASLHTLAITSWSRATELDMVDFAFSLPDVREEHLPNLCHFVNSPSYSRYRMDMSLFEEDHFTTALNQNGISYDCGHLSNEDVSYLDCMGDPCAMCDESEENNDNDDET